MNALPEKMQQATADRQALGDHIKRLAEQGFLHPYLVEKFRVPENRIFLDKALHNAQSPWHYAVVAQWALNNEGLQKFAEKPWNSLYPEQDLQALLSLIADNIRLKHVHSLREYRRHGMHHYPRLSEEEFETLLGDDWTAIIDFPSGRDPEYDIPSLTPFEKQGDIEHSLYRHFIMPALVNYFREHIPKTTAPFELSGRDRNLLLSIPLVVQQVHDELFNHVKVTFANLIQRWADQCRTKPEDKLSRALLIAEKIWDFRRTPAARECNNPVDNLVKGFSATIRNAFGHFSDINIAASGGKAIDPFDVTERFVLYASVSNGQLDNLATAHQHYVNTHPDPTAWNGSELFAGFLELCGKADLHQIQGHFQVDKTRGCPAIPLLAKFHVLVLDVMLEFMLREFGEAKLREAGNWYLQEKTPGKFT